MSTYQTTTHGEKKQILLRRRTPYPHVFGFLQNRIDRNEHLLLQMTLEQEQLPADCEMHWFVMEYQKDRLRAIIKRDYEHLHKITVS